MLIWHNGDFVEVQEPRLSATAAGTLLGLGAFTTLGVWNGRTFALSRHLNRLRTNLVTMGVECPYSDSELADALSSLLANAAISRGMARITVTARGDGRWFSDTGSDVTIVAQPIEQEPVSALRLTLSPYRIESRRATSGLKSTSYADAYLAWREAHERGFDEAVMCNSSGAICEGTRSNLFWGRGAVLYTPSLDCGPLPGIARELVLKWAGKAGMLVREGTFSLADLGAADEIFTTSSTFGPRAVSSFDEDTYRAPGPLTLRLSELWTETVRVETQ